jgi:2-dehydro-3-deoxy-D-arabinonate dehydratase
MRLYRTAQGPVLEVDGQFHRLTEAWDALVGRETLGAYLATIAAGRKGQPRIGAPVLAPVGAQEVWAAGVTYARSRTARVEESKAAGGGDFYDRVYDAARPELFFKAPGWRARGPGQPIRIRRDARWSVPEPELAVCLNPRGEIVGYTIGNDVSARDVEGENPLYLPQAKIYDGACALGPAWLIRHEPLPPETEITVRIVRAGATRFEGRTTLASMRRSPAELAAFLYRETTFPYGCVLLTGTGVVPPDDVTLQSGDAVHIEIAPIGTLANPVE